MKDLERRLGRLEERLGARSGPIHILLTNVPPEDCQDSPCVVEIAPGLWAEAIGGVFSAEEIAALRKEYADR